MKQLATETKSQLKLVSTATIATYLFKKGLKNQFIQGVVPLKKKNENMVGLAYTLRYIPAREDRNPISIFENKKHPQRVAVEECPAGFVLVIDSRKDARAASAGSILISRLLQRGVEGIVTDGGFRDSKEIAQLNFNAYHQKPVAPTNLSLHEAIETNTPIGCGDVAVFPGDVLVGDDDGVMVIPFELADEVAAACTKMTAYENFVIEKVQEGNSVIGLYPLTDAKWKDEYDAWLEGKN